MVWASCAFGTWIEGREGTPAVVEREEGVEKVGSTRVGKGGWW